MKKLFIMSCFLLLFVLFEGESANFQTKMNYYSNRNPYRADFAYPRKAYGGQHRATVFGGPNGETITYGNSVKLSGSHSQTSSKRIGLHKRLQETQMTQSQIETAIKLNEKVATLEVATIFKDNLIKVFGYILHRTDMELNSELYTSLYFILQTIKLNVVNIISIVPMLSELSFVSSNERFLRIFQLLEEHLPEYLTNTATLWKDAIRKNEVNMDNILEPYGDGPLIVDIFDKLQKEILDKVAKQEILEPEKNAQEKKILFNFNPNIVQIMRYMEEHKNETQQMFVGALIHFFPRGLSEPILEESVQFLTEWLEQNEIEEWESYVRLISKGTIEDPFIIVTELLYMITDNDDINYIVKNSAQMITDSLTDRNPTAINTNYVSISSLVSLDKIEMEYMLNYVAFGAYPLDTVSASTRLKYYLKHGYIRYLSLFLFFNPYLYSSSMEIMIAVLERVIKQQPDLPLEVTDSAGVVYSYLTFFIRYIHLPAIMPDDFQNLNILFFGLRAPDIEASLKVSFVKLVGFLQEEPFSYQVMLQEIPPYKCATPVTCLMELLTFMIKKQIASKVQEVHISVILSSWCYWCQYKLESLNKVNSNYSLIPPRELTPPDVVISDTTFQESDKTTSPFSKTTSAPTEGPIKTASTAKPTPPTTPTALPLPSKIPTGATATLPADYQAFITIVEEIAKDVDLDERYVKVILNEFETKEFKEQYKELIEKNGHQVVITMILTQLASKLEDSKHFTDNEIAEHVRQYLRKFYNVLNRVEIILEKITFEAELDKPLLFSLVAAVKVPETQEEEKMFKGLENLLQRQDVLEVIFSHLQTESFKNVGTLLKAILAEEIKLKKGLSESELEVAKYYQDKVESVGFAQQKVPHATHNISIIRSNIDISKTFDNSLGFKSLTRANKKKFNEVVSYLRRHRNLLKSWDKWIFYTKSAEFTKAVMQLIQDQGTVPPTIRDAVDTLLPLIHFDGNGEKPIHYKE